MKSAHENTQLSTHAMPNSIQFNRIGWLLLWLVKLINYEFHQNKRTSSRCWMASQNLPKQHASNWNKNKIKQAVMSIINTFLTNNALFFALLANGPIIITIELNSCRKTYNRWFNKRMIFTFYIFYSLSF